MEKVLEFQKCKIEHGTEKNISIKNQDMPEVTSGVTDQTPLNNGSSTFCMEVQTNSSYKDGLLISE